MTRSEIAVRAIRTDVSIRKIDDPTVALCWVVETGNGDQFAVGPTPEEAWRNAEYYASQSRHPGPTEPGP